MDKTSKNLDNQTIAGSDMNSWYKKMFEGKLGEYWLNISDQKREATELQVSFLREVLTEGWLLDHGCGPCRISIPLSTHRSVVGLDLSKYLLQRGKKRAKLAEANNLHLVRADMRYLPFKPEAFENTINLWTGFGYFSEEENEVVLTEIARVLKVDGKFILDMANPIWLIRNFREKDWSEDGDYLSLQQRSVDWKRKRWKARWIVINKETKDIDEISFYHRLYDLQELEALLNKKGLEPAQVYGSFRKDGFDEAGSNRIIILSRKSDV